MSGTTPFNYLGKLLLIAMCIERDKTIHFLRNIFFFHHKYTFVGTRRYTNVDNVLGSETSIVMEYTIHSYLRKIPVDSHTIR